MADLTSASIDIVAPAEQVLAVIADFGGYPQWVDSMKSAEVLTFTGGRAHTVRMVLDHPLVKDDYVLAYEWAPSRVSWKLVDGKLLKAMDGSYALEPSGTGSGTRVTYTLQVDVNMPMIGLFKRKAEKTIIDGALKGLKVRVEGRA